MPRIARFEDGRRWVVQTVIPAPLATYLDRVAESWTVSTQIVCRDAVIAGLDTPRNWTPRAINTLVPPGTKLERHIRIYLPADLGARVDELAAERLMDRATMSRVLLLAGLQKIIDQAHMDKEGQAAPTDPIAV